MVKINRTRAANEVPHAIFYCWQTHQDCSNCFVAKHGYETLSPENCHIPQYIKMWEMRMYVIKRNPNLTIQGILERLIAKSMINMVNPYSAGYYAKLYGFTTGEARIVLKRMVANNNATQCRILIDENKEGWGYYAKPAQKERLRAMLEAEGLLRV